MAISFSSYQSCLKTVFINLNHARATNDQLSHDMMELGIDIAGIN